MLAAFVAAGCGGDDDDEAAVPPPPADDAAEEQGQDGGDAELEPIRVSFSHAVLFDVRAFDAVAEAQGFYAEEGIEVSHRDFTGGGADGIQALVSGGVDVVIGVGAFAAYSAIQQEAPISIASALYHGYRDIVYYAPADSDIESLEDAAGRTVAISRPGATTDLVCRKLGESLTGAGEKAPECVTLGSPPDIFTAVTTGQVDVGWTAPPFFFDEMDGGKIKRIGTGDDIDVLRGTTARFNMIRDGFLEEHPESAQAFFRAYEKAFEWMFENPDEAVEIWAKAAEVEVTPGLADDIFDIYTEEAFAARELNDLDVSLEAARELGFLEADLSEEDVQDVSAIDRIFEDE